MTNFIGIDLGTCFSAVSFIDDTGRPTIVHNPDGVNITPSCVLFDDDGGVQVGEVARKSWDVGSNNVGARFKRDMGSSKTTLQVGNDSYTPTDLSTEVLKSLAADTEKAISAIGEAVVTIPANFSHEARDATMAAAQATLE